MFLKYLIQKSNFNINFLIIYNSYFYLIRNRVYVNDKIYHANILVKGPKGSLNVELHAEANI